VSYHNTTLRLNAENLDLKFSIAHPPQFSEEVNECVELYLHSPNTPSWRGAQLKEAQG